MMRTLLLTLLLAIALVPGRSWAGLPHKNRTLAGYVLTYSEFLELSLEQKVAYYKFLVQYLGQLEEMHEGPGKTKTAALRLQLLQILPEAYADSNYTKDASILGKPCIFGLETSVYYKSPSSGQYRCQPKLGSSTCGSGQVACPNSLLQIAQKIPGKENESLCVDGPYYGVKPGFSRRCYEKLENVTGLKLDEGIAKQMVSFSTEQQKQYKDFVEGMRVHLTEMQKQSFGNSDITIRDYCGLGKSSSNRGLNAMNGNLQAEECTTLLKLVDSFDAATDEAPQPAAETIPTKSDTTEVSVDKAPDTETDAPAAATADGEEPPAATDASDSTTEAPKEKAAPPATPDEKAPVVKKKAPPVPREKPTKSQDCPSRHQTKLGPLACVACGLEQATNSKKSTYDNYIALLGAVAQKQGPYNVETSSGRGQLQARVAEMIGSYGYCSDAEYKINIEDKNIRDWIDGQKTRGPYDKVFGLKGGFLFFQQIDNLFPEKDFGRDMSVSERNARFRSEAKDYVRANGASAFASCAKGIGTRLTENAPFKFICMKNGMTGATAVQRNNEFRRVIAKACGVSVTKEKAGPCGKKCRRPNGGNPCHYNESRNCCEERGSKDNRDHGGHKPHGEPPKEPTEHESPRNPRGPGESENNRPDGGGANGDIRGSGTTN